MVLKIDEAFAGDEVKDNAVELSLQSQLICLLLIPQTATDAESRDLE